MTPSKSKLTKEDLEKWDERITKALKDLRVTRPNTGPVSFKKICLYLGVDPHGKRDDDFRVVDRRLQALKRQGLVLFDGEWKVLPEAKDLME
jgi:hypothetical protein